MSTLIVITRIISTGMVSAVLPSGMKKWARHQMLIKSFVKSIVVLLQKVRRRQLMI